MAMGRQWGFTSNTQAGYPPYLNISEQYDGSFMVTVRSNPTFDGREGNTAAIVISREDFLKYIVDIMPIRLSHTGARG